MFLMVCIFLKVLPKVEREVKALSYFQLIKSVFMLFIQERTLRIRSVLAMLIFADFSILWTPLVLPLSAPPLTLSHSVIGAFGLIGVAGALAAAQAGKFADRVMDKNNRDCFSATTHFMVVYKLSRKVVICISCWYYLAGFGRTGNSCH